MSKHDFKALTWRELIWQRPFELSSVQDALTNLATLSPRGAVVFEARGCGGKVRYLIGCEECRLPKIERVFKAHGDVSFEHIYQKPRKTAMGAAQLKTS